MLKFSFGGKFLLLFFFLFFFSTVDRDAEIELSNKLPFEFNASLEDHLYTVEQLHVLIYTTVNFKDQIKCPVCDRG